MIGKYFILLSILFASLSFGHGIDSIEPINEVTGTYQAEYVRDLDGIVQIQFSGNLDVPSLADPKVFEPRATIAREFYETHLDKYDFLIVLSDFDYDLPDDVGAFYMGAKNEIKGISKPVFDNANSYGSNGRLKGYIDFHSINDWELDPNQSQFFSTLVTLSHEVMHAWGGGVHFEDESGHINDGLIGDGAHWNALYDSSGSVMYGHRWLSMGNNKYKALEPELAYSPLDLYLAGFYDSSEVPDFILHESNDTEKTDKRINGEIITVTDSLNISIEQVISAEGIRVPSSQNSQKTFNAALILLTSDASHPTPKTLLGLNNLKNNFENTFSQMTGGRGIINFHAEEFNSKGEVTEETYRTNLDVDDAVSWLLGQQSIIGFWGEEESQRIRHTEIANSVLSDILGSESYDPSHAQEWLSSQDVFSNVEDASSLASINEKAKEFLIGNKNANGTWGINESYEGSIVDTAKVLSTAPWAKNKANIDYLVKHQNSDGGWSLAENGISIPSITSSVLKALHVTGSLTTDTLTPAIQFLASKQTANGSFDIENMHSVLEAAIVIDSLVKVNQLTAIDFNAALSFLERNQLENGSWNNDVYTTAFIVNVLKDVQLPNLTINSIVANEVNVGIGNKVIVTLDVSNFGGVPSSPVEVGVFDQGALLSSQQLTGLSQNQGTELTFDLDVGDQPGSKRLTFVIDDAGVLAEKTKTDNKSFVDIIVLDRPEGVDLAIESASILSPSEINLLPANIRLSVNLKNLGKTDSVSPRLIAYTEANGNQTILQEQSLSLNSLESKSAELDVAIQSSHTSELFVEVVDDLDAVLFNNKVKLELPFEGGIDYLISDTDLVGPNVNNIVNSDIEFSARVWNKGVTAAPTTEVIYSIKNQDEITEIARYTTSLNSNEYTDHSFVWRPKKAGDYQLVALIDPDNLVSEINESNNGAIKDLTVSVEEGSNLSVSYKDIVISQTEILESQSMTAATTIWNKGVDSVEPSTVNLYLGNPKENGRLLDIQNIPAIDGGSSHTLDLTWQNIDLSGKQNIYTVVDPSNSISETNEDDNTAFVEIDITPVSDLSISDRAIHMNPSILFEASTATVDFDVLNLGGQLASSFNIKMFVNNIEIGQLNDLEIAPYSKATFQHSFVVDSSYSGGNLRIEIDPENRIVERNEDNNEAIYPIVLSDSSFYVSEYFISPNGDGIKDSTDIFYRLDTQTSVTIKITNSNGEVVLEQAGLPETDYFNWNGKNQLGLLLPDGAYSVSLMDETTGTIFNSTNIEIDNNRSSLSDAIGTKFGETINVSENFGELELRYPFYTYDNDQKIYFTADDDGMSSSLYRANYDGSELEELFQGISGEVVREYGDWILIRSGSSERITEVRDFSLFNVKTSEKLNLVNLLGLDRFADSSFVSFVFTGSNIARLLMITDDKENTLLYEINLIEQTSSILTSLTHQHINTWTTHAFSTKEGSIGYFRNENVSLYGNLLTGDIELLNFQPLNVDETTQQLIGFKENSQEIIVSDLFGNEISRHQVDLEKIDYALFDGSRQTAVIFENDNAFWGCGGLNGGLLDGSEFDPNLGGTHIVDLITGKTTKIANITAAYYEECMWKETLPLLQTYNANYEDLLKVEGLPVSVQDMGSSHTSRNIDSFFGVLKNGMFINNSSYLLSPEFVLNTNPDAIGDIGENPYHQSTGLIQYDLSGSYQEISLLFNDKRIERVQYSNDDQFLMLTNRRTVDTNDYSLFRSLLNLSTNLDTTYNSKNQVVDINVLAADKNFDYYELFYREVGEKNWVSLVEPRSTQVLGENIHAWVPPSEAIYTVKLVAYDKAGNSREITSTVPWGRSNPITSIKIDKEIFSPNSDGVKDTLNVSYTVNRPYNLQIQFFNEDEQLVREESISHDTAENYQSFIWDGLDQFGAKLPDGRYKVVVDGVELHTLVDATIPVITSDCTDYLLNSGKDEDITGFFNPYFCINLTDEHLTDVAVYRKSDVSDWMFYKAIESTNDKYNISVANHSDFIDYQYQVRASDLAGNVLVSELDNAKKLNYFRFIGAYRSGESLSEEPTLDHFFAQPKEPLDNQWPEEVNLDQVDSMALLNSYSEGDIEYQISIDGVNWEAIDLNSLPRRSMLLNRVSLNGVSLTEGNKLRAVLNGSGETVISNEVILSYKADYESEVTIQSIGETSARVELDKRYTGNISIEMFSLTDEVYSIPAVVYIGSAAELESRVIETSKFNSQICETYKFNIIEDGIIRETISTGAPCIQLLDVLSKPDSTAECNEVAESLTVNFRIYSQSQGVINYATAELFVNNLSKGFVFTSLEPVVNSDRKGTLYNVFSLDTKSFEENDQVYLEITVTSDEGETVSRKLVVPVDKEIPIFTQSRDANSCAVSMQDGTYYQLNGQLIDRNSSSAVHGVAYGINYSQSSSPNNTHYKNTVGPIKYRCEGLSDLAKEACDDLSNQVGNELRDTRDGSSILIKQGIIDFIPISKSSLDGYLHAYDQSGNHACVRIVDTVDFEIEGLDVNLENWVLIDDHYYSNVQNSSLLGGLTLKADEALTVKIKLVENIDGEPGEDLHTVYEGQYANGLLEIGPDDIQYQDGRYLLVVQVMDDCGISQEKTYKVVLDSKAPTVILDSPTSNPIRSIVDLFGSISDDNLSRYTLEFKATTNNTWITLDEVIGSRNVENTLLKRWDVSALDGVYDLRMSASDKSGNVTEYIQTFNVVNDQLILVNFDLENRYISSLDDAQSIDLIVQTQKDASGLISLNDSQLMTTELKAGINTVAMPVSLLTTFEDGIYTLTVEAFEVANPSIKESLDIQVILDATQSAVEVKEVEDKPSGYLSIKWNDTNHQQTEITITSQQTGDVYAYAYTTNSTRTFDFATLNVEEGWFDIQITSLDLAQNETVVKQTVLYDRTSPLVTLVSELDSYLNQKSTPITLEIAVDDAYLNSIQIKANDLVVLERDIETSGTITEELNLNNLADGETSLSILVEDLAGNSTIINKTVTLDSISPVLDEENSVWSIGKDALISFQYIEDNIDRVETTLGGQDVYTIYRQNEGSIPWPASLSDGEYTLTLKAFDLAGNETVKEVTVSRDTLPPLAVGNLSYELKAGTAIQLTWLKSASSDVDVYRLYRNNALITEVSENSYLDNQLATGVYEYRVTAIDKFGNESESSNTVDVIIDTTPPSIEIVSLMTGQTVSGLVPVTLTIPDSDLLSYEVTLTTSVGTKSSLATGSLPIFNQDVAVIDTINLENSVDVTVVAEDVAGNRSTKSVSLSIDNAVPAAPSISAVLENDVVTLTVNQLDANAASFLIYRNDELLTTLEQATLTTWTDTLISDGFYSYYVVQKSRSNVPSMPSNIEQVYLDLTAPKFAILSPIPDGLYELQLDVDIDYLDNDIDTVDITILDSSKSNILLTTNLSNAQERTELDITNLAYGDYVISVGVKDLTGNTSTQEVTFFVEDITAPDPVSDYSWRTEEGTLFINWQYDPEKATAQDVQQFNLVLRDHRGSYLESKIENNAQRQSQFSVEEGEYSVDIYVVDSAGNRSLITKVNGIEVIKPNVVIPYTPDVLADKTLTINSDFFGGLWVEKDGQVIHSQSVNIGDVVELPLVLDMGVNSYKVYGDYEDNITIPVYFDLTLSSYPEVSGTAVYDGALELITISRQPEENELGYLLFDNQNSIKDVAVSSTSNSRLTDGNTEYPVNIYDDISTYEIVYTKQELLTSIDIVYPDSYWSPENVSLKVWTGSNWIEVPHAVLESEEGVSLELNKPYLSSKISLTFYKPRSQYLMRVSEIISVVHKIFSENEINTNDFVFENNQPYLKVVNTHGIVSEGHIQVTDISESLLAPEVMANVNGSDVTLEFNLPSDATSVHLFRDNIDIGSFTNTQNNFVDDSLMNGSYTYYVVSYDDLGNRSPLSNQVVVDIYTPLLDKPEDLVATSQAEAIHLSWSAVAGAKEYQVFRKTTLSDQWIELSTTQEVQYLDTSALTGTPYMYKVAALDEIDNLGDSSDFVTALIQRDVELVAPKIISPLTNSYHQNQVDILVKSEGVPYIGINVNGSNSNVFAVNDRLSDSKSFYAQGYTTFTGLISSYVDSNRKVKSIANNTGEASITTYMPRYVSGFEGGSYFSDQYQISRYTNADDKVEILNISYNQNDHIGLNSSRNGNVVVFNDAYSMWAFDVTKSEKQMIASGYFRDFEYNRTSLDQTGNNIAYIYNRKLYISSKQVDGKYAQAVELSFDYESVQDMTWIGSDLIVLYTHSGSPSLAKFNQETSQWSEDTTIPLTNLTLIGELEDSVVLLGFNEQNQYQLVSYDSNLKQNWLFYSPFTRSELDLTTTGQICLTRYSNWECLTLPGFTTISIPIENGETNVISAYGIDQSGLYSKNSNLINILSDSDEFINASVNLLKIESLETEQITLLADVRMMAGIHGPQDLHVTLLSEDGQIVVDEYQTLEPMTQRDVAKVPFSFIPEGDTSYVASAMLSLSDSDPTDNRSTLKFYIADPNSDQPDIQVIQRGNNLELILDNVEALTTYQISLEVESSDGKERFLWNEGDVVNQRVSISVQDLNLTGSLDLIAELSSEDAVLDTDNLTINRSDLTQITGDLQVPSLIVSDEIRVETDLYGEAINGYFNGSYSLTLLDNNGSFVDTAIGTINWLSQGETFNIIQEFDLSNVGNGDYLLSLEVVDTNGVVKLNKEQVFAKQIFDVSLDLDKNKIVTPTRTSVTLPIRLEGVMANYIEGLVLSLESSDATYDQSLDVTGFPFSGDLTFNNLNHVANIEGKLKVSYQVNLDGAISQESQILETVHISVVDVTAPELVTVSPSHNGYLNDSGVITLEVIDSDNSDIYAEFVQNEIYRQFSASGNLITLPNSILSYGPNTFEMSLVDAFGNKRALDPYTVIYDNIAPTIQAEASTDDVYSKIPFTFTSTVSDDHLLSASVELNGDAQSNSTITISEDGEYRYEVNAEDKAGNTNVRGLTKVLDQTPPTISITGVEHETLINEDVAFSVTLTEANMDQFKVELNGSELELTSATASSRVVSKLLTEEGQYVLTVNAVDKAGWNAELEAHFEIDKTAPAEPVLDYLDGHTFDVGLVNLQGSSEANTTVKLDVNGTNYYGLSDGNGQFEFTNVEINIGQNAVSIMSIDKAGNESQAAAYTYYRMDSLDIEGELSESGINTDRVLFFVQQSDASAALTGYLSDQDLDVTVVSTTEQFMEQVRTLSYSTVLVSDVNGFNGLINKVGALESLELRSYIVNGLNVLLLDGNVSFLNLWGDVLGLKNISVPFKASEATVSSESIGNLSIKDTMVAYDLTPYNSAFSFGQLECQMLAIICHVYGATPALVLNQYGNGYAATFGFDVLNHIDEVKSLINELIQFIKHSNVTNFEHRDLTLLLTANQNTSLVEDRISIKVASNGNALINGSSYPLVVRGQDELDLDISRIQLDQTVQLDAAIYVDDILKDEVSLSMFEAITWNDLLTSLDTEIENMDVHWLETLAHVKLQYLVSEISEQCDITTCNVIDVRNQVYLAMLKWRVSFKSHVSVLKHFGEVLMYLDYVERKQGAL